MNTEFEYIWSPNKFSLDLNLLDRNPTKIKNKIKLFILWELN